MTLKQTLEKEGLRHKMEDWARDYLTHFVMQARKRADDMIKKFVEPFEKYIK